ncbi:hypothetical protein BJ980_002582 [Nocardioides daedukensis]|uniref:Uncharacterized protein n=1 Tax=Nocardioides daedukensis TaxID=634462 RepID=A0A7Y9S278_9ACTN|nr:hypothetical protein [Nocardioides daedukensis]NYG59659.1 hypothetical protein [Nocardioides daedukensis]
MPVALFQGQQVVPVVPGNHLVAGHGQWMWQYGRAELPVHVQQGQTVDVHYKLPMITFMKGAIGFGPVKAPGKLALVLLLTAIIAIPVLLILVGVLAS